MASGRIRRARATGPTLGLAGVAAIRPGRASAQGALGLFSLGDSPTGAGRSLGGAIALRGPATPVGPASTRAPTSGGAIRAPGTVVERFISVAPGPRPAAQALVAAGATRGGRAKGSRRGSSLVAFEGPPLAGHGGATSGAG